MPDPSQTVSRTCIASNIVSRDTLDHPFYLRLVVALIVRCCFGVVDRKEDIHV
jgi:hypothetical protein